MKVLHINMTYDYGSTGRFIKYIKEELEKEGHGCNVVCSFARGQKEGILETQSSFVQKVEIVLGRILGNHGLNCYMQTHKALQFIKQYHPDVIHLHNLHGDYINFELLFKFIKKYDIPVIWKLPDCWSFTGHCAYYDYIQCDQWKKGCGKCPQLGQYPVSWIRDYSSEMLEKKKKAFSGVKRMILTPPSNWLKGQVEQSYLKQYKIVVVNNGTDTNNFKPVNDDKVRQIRSDGKIVVLGVVFGFDIRKGLDYFNFLAEKLPEHFKIILVGIKDEKKYMNSRIQLIGRTESVSELAQYYSAADVFVNPTLEENFPSVNIEALSCGTPIVAFDTGGATEAFSPETGVIVKKGDKEELLKSVIYVGEKKPFKSSDCVKRSKLFTKETMIQKYIELYNEVIKYENT